MKKVLAVVMTAVLAAGMTISAFASEDLADKKIALLLPGSIDDQGWNATKNSALRSMLLRACRQKSMSPPLPNMLRKAMT